ncbi:hypothetical protein [Cutibacterium avidum]|uniref:hypothetical protein n=1 Tax=Cutibacterium avidum TaxID=33010 RepID=UPI002FEEE737
MPLGLTRPDNVRLEVAMHVPGLVITGLAFFDNVFIPLSDTMPTIGRWGPRLRHHGSCPLPVDQRHGHWRWPRLLEVFQRSQNNFPLRCDFPLQGTNAVTGVTEERA